MWPTFVVMALWCCLLLSAAISSSAMDSDLYFYVQEQVPRCFSEDLPGDTTLVGSYKHPDQGIKKLRVLLLDPHGEKLYEKKLEEAGRFAYHVANAGEHRICIEASGDGDGPWPVNSKTAKFHLKIEIQGKDSTAAISDDVVRKDHITDLTGEIVHLERLIDLILADLQYLKQQELHFTEQSERVNDRIMWWSMLQTCLLLISGFWQVAHLKQFFRAKKLV